MTARDGWAGITVAVCLGLTYVCIKIGLGQIPPLLLAALRFFLTAIPAIFFVQKPVTETWKLFAFGLTFGVLLFGFMNISIGAGMPAGLAAVVIQTQTFFTLAFAYAIFKERPTKQQLAAALIAALGMALLVWDWPGTVSLTAVLYVIAAALSWSAANTLAKSMGKIDMFALIIYASAIATPVLLLLSLCFEGANLLPIFSAELSPKTVLAILFLAYPATLLAFSLWNQLLSRYPAATVTPYALLIPVIGLVTTHVLLGEQLTIIQIFGSALVLGSVLLASRRRDLAVPASHTPRVKS